MDNIDLLTGNALLPDSEFAWRTSSQKAIFEQIVILAEASPESIAILSNSTSWTYSDLTKASREFCAKLGEVGIRQGDVVAIRGDSCFGLISTILGVFAAAAVIVLVDRNLPHNRATKLVRDSGASLVVHVHPQKEEAGAIEIIAGLSRLDVDSGTGRTYATCPAVDNSKDGNRLGDRLPDDAAYIFFTSGTTGTPKGVVGSHKGLSHFLNWQRTQFAVGPTDRVAQVTGLMFDVVMREMFLPLTSGATLCIPGKHLDESSLFWRWLCKHTARVKSSSDGRGFGKTPGYGLLSRVPLPKHRRQRLLPCDCQSGKYGYQRLGPDGDARRSARHWRFCGQPRAGIPRRRGWRAQCLYNHRLKSG